jgi:hypothetical protein
VFDKGLENFTESVEDLHLLVEDDKSFKEAFPQAQLRSAIIKAFKAGGSLKPDDMPTQMSQPTKPNLTTMTKQNLQLSELPPHKSFGAFISHKKVPLKQLKTYV